MAENYSKSRLKRKKSCVTEYEPEISSRAPPRKSPPTLPPADCNVTVTVTAEADRSVAPAAVWWNREQLPAAETLYALTLKSALQHLENQHWDLVPDLPVPSTARDASQQVGEQQWCDLSEEVPPFPEPDQPDPLSLNSSQQTRQGESSSAGPSSVREEEGRRAGEHEEEEKEKRETRLVNKQPLTNQGKVFDSRAPPQKEGRDEEEEDVQRIGRGDEGVAAGGRLQTCPMCLLVFPAGFTQMDCDSHLAQCLSEMNVDITW
ncbi:uncharacterized protein si:ch73-70k4.1 [Thunnus albacares]|uniref:uncharacterized protein si:ch73-70k4.1 n=1 Tax=Thunnus albacares TaxID=8236 RepID=UPI001CF6A5F9|nr:uncharacterized protein si:ch73-70k4.1 [Thunnus albacares]